MPSDSAPYKGPINQPCSACSDGDTAMQYHDHDYVAVENRVAMPSDEPKNPYYCCKADFGEHESTCVNAKPNDLRALAERTAREVYDGNFSGDFVKEDADVIYAALLEAQQMFAREAAARFKMNESSQEFYEWLIGAAK